jgi:hypothetical protein
MKGNRTMGLPGMVISGISAAVGAIMYWAVTAQSSNVVQNHGFGLSTVGVILMIAGAPCFVISTAVFAASRRSPAAPSRISHSRDGRRGGTHLAGIRKAELTSLSSAARVS